MISFQSLAYYLYIAIGATPFQFINKGQARKAFLFALNLCFHLLLFYYSKKHLIVLFALVVTNYGISHLVASKKQWRAWLAPLQVTFLVGVLCFFKYSIFNTPILGLFPFFKALLKPAVFIGVSFFSFKMISVSIDLKRGSLRQPLNFIDYCNFVLFFPCFLSGPLDRYDNFVRSFDQPIDDTKAPDRIFNGIFRIVWGAFKKGVIADSLYGLSLVSISTEDMMTLPLGTVILSLFIYSWVLYIDFSGYSDIAIGVSRLFGINTPENFNNPYFSRNLQEFWNRWHISFMHWLRDYIFFPIQMSLLKMGVKSALLVACVASFAVFFIAGVWHGDTLHYALYGLSHALSFCIFLSYRAFIEKSLTKDQLASYNSSRVVRASATFLTYLYFSFSLLFFLDKWQLFGRLL